MRKWVNRVTDLERTASKATMGLNIFEPRHVFFQQCGILTSVDSEEPVQPPFKQRNSK